MQVKYETKAATSSGTAGMESGRLSVDPRIPKVDDRMVACENCGKTFRTKKALSGHSRVHRKNSEESTTTKCRKLAAGSGKTPTCALCGRTFRSMPALYGHMRTHLNRGWRGVIPPVTVVKTQPFVASDVYTAVIPGWSGTGKRGRRSITSVDSGSLLSTTRKGLEKKDNIQYFEGEASGTAKRAMANRSVKNRRVKRKVRQLDKINRGPSTDVVVRVSADKSFTSQQALDGHRLNCDESNQSAGAGQVVPSLLLRTEFSEGPARGVVAVTYLFTELFPRLCSGNAECSRRLADFDLNELPALEESGDDKGEPNAE